MEAKEYLLQIRAIKAKINIINEQLEEIDAQLYGRAIQYDTVPVGNGDSDPLLRLVLKRIEAENKLRGEQIQLYEKEQEIRSVVFKLKEAREIQVLYLRYFKMMKWEELSEQLFYSIRWIKDIHESALANLQEILDNTAL